MALREMSLRNIRSFLTLPAAFSSRRTRQLESEHKNEQTKQATHFQSMIEHSHLYSWSTQ